MTGAEVEARALGLLGVPFRLHGRDPRGGLDCIGLACRALQVRADVPTGYRMAGTAAPWLAWFDRWGFKPIAPEKATSGDIWLVQHGPRQHHVMVGTSAGFVHAHAGLGRVVLLPPPCNWRVTAILRAPWLD